MHSGNGHAALSFEAMGCRFEVLIGIERSGLSGIECSAVCEEIRELVLDWHARLSVFDDRSVVSRINRSGAGESVEVDEEMLALLGLSERMRERTGGAFNIAAGTLMHAHGFRERAIDDVGGLSIENAFVLDLDARTITKADGRIVLDFGAIAKGYVLDLIRAELMELGIRDAFVHGGTSSVLALGEDLEGRPWTVSAGGGVDVVLNGMTMGISEIDGSVVKRGERIEGHVMDPMGMGPARSGVSRVVCVHGSGAEADAYSTACCVSPGIASRLSDDPCTLIVFEGDRAETMHDPLGVVRSISKDEDD